MVYGALERVGVLEDKSSICQPAVQWRPADCSASAPPTTPTRSPGPSSLNEERTLLAERIAELKANDAPMRDIVQVEKQRRDLPRDADEARWQRWGAGDGRS